MLDCDGIVVRHHIDRRLKHAYLRVEEDGDVVLRSNGRNPDALRAFVLSKRAWIERQRQRLEAGPGMRPGENILYLGESVPLGHIGAHAFCTGTASALRRSYDRFYKARAEEMLEAKTRDFAGRMGIGFSEIRFRKMKRRWGSCSKEGVITYNTLLMQLPEPMIDYTVVHELAHRIHFNHSADFHALVAAFIPQERETRRRMRHMRAVTY